MDLVGKTALITGATSGIGAAVAERLATQAGTLIVHGPQPETEQAQFLEHLRDQGSAPVEYLQADFARLSDVASLADRVRDRVGHLDLLVNNAVAAPTPDRVVTVDGYELAWQVNYLAMVSLTARLRSIVRERIVNLTSETHRSTELDFDDLQLGSDYSAFAAYSRTKLAIITFTEWLAHRLSADGPLVVAVCPGLTDTPLLHAMFPGATGQPVARAAANVLAGATDDLPTGTYTHDGQILSPSAATTDPAGQTRLITVTGSMLGQSLENAFPTAGT